MNIIKAIQERSLKPTKEEAKELPQRGEYLLVSPEISRKAAARHQETSTNQFPSPEFVPFCFKLKKERINFPHKQLKKGKSF